MGDWISLDYTIALSQKECGPATIGKMCSWAKEQDINLTYEFSPRLGLPYRGDTSYVYWHFRNEKDKIAFSIYFSLGC